MLMFWGTEEKSWMSAHLHQEMLCVSARLNLQKEKLFIANL